jgi:alcohol dehydrogenase class IV
MKEEQQEQKLYNVSITPNDPNGIGLNFEAGILLQHYNDDNSIIFVLKSPKKKIIPIKLKFTNTGNKESQKELIKEIMDLDAKDGLYDTVNDTVNELDKLAEKTFKGDDATVFVQREIWKDGYKKAKETLYTEEQVREAMSMARKLSGVAYTNDEIIQSLKQNFPL